MNKRQQTFLSLCRPSGLLEAAQCDQNKEMFSHGQISHMHEASPSGKIVFFRQEVVMKLKTGRGGV